MSAALIDAGPLIAVFGASDKQARRYTALLAKAAQEHWSLSTTWPCVIEACHMLAPPRNHSLLRWIAGGAIAVFPFKQEDLFEMIEWMERYTQTPRTEMNLADASLVWLANDTGVVRVMTLDVRDFSRYRLPDGRAFEIL